MPRVRDEPTPRRSVVPDAGVRSLWFAAVWTGVGAALVCAVAAIIAVAICWLPVSGASSGSHTDSVLRAGLLTFLLALHGGATVAGEHTSWVPLGMWLLVGLAAWRAGAGLADAAAETGDSDPRVLGRAFVLQAAAFTAAALVAVPFAHLGTSSITFLSAGLGGVISFALAGGTAFLLASPLRERFATAIPRRVAGAARAALGALVVQLGGGALLVAGSLVLHHGQVRAITDQVGSGWGGVPVLLLGVLAAPNAVVAGASYLLGPGFALGSGTDVHLFAGAHGTLPAFPLLGALPSGNGAAPAPVAAALATVLLAGIVLAALSARADTWAERVTTALGGAALGAGALFVLAAATDGSIGTGRLRVVGASPWEVGAAGLAELFTVSLAGLGLLAAWRWVRDPVDSEDEVGFLLRPTRRSWIAADEYQDVEGEPDDLPSDELVAEPDDESDDEDEGTPAAASEGEDSDEGRAPEPQVARTPKLRKLAG